MMQIAFHDLHMTVSLGVYPWEKDAPRAISMDITVRFDEGKASVTDSIDDTMDYARLEQRLLALGASRHFNLLESLVAEAGMLVLEDPRAQEVTVTVHKPGAVKCAKAVSMTATFKKR